MKILWDPACRGLWVPSLGSPVFSVAPLFLRLSDSGPANPGCALSVSSLAGCFPVPLLGGSEGMLWVGWVFFQVGKCECGSGGEKSGDFRLLHGKVSRSASSTKWGLYSLLPQTWGSWDDPQQTLSESDVIYQCVSLIIIKPSRTRFFFFFCIFLEEKKNQRRSGYLVGFCLFPLIKWQWLSRCDWMSLQVHQCILVSRVRNWCSEWWL